VPREINTDIWVAALVRRAQLGGAFATVVRKGDPERGEAVVKVSPARGRAVLYAPAFNPDGPLEFEALPRGVSEPSEIEVDELIAKRARSDRDLWVVEIEDRDGRHFLTERIRA
jgi:hypothetical protein